jgi:hypothetical protein
MIGIILLAGVLRFWEVAEMPLRADEASVVFLSAEKPADIIAPFVSSDPHMPL